MNRVMKRLDMPSQTECWTFVGALDSGGYGQMSFNRERKMVHRVMYESMHGPIPDGLVVDHLCRVRHCANPLHLEAVTHRENILRGEGFAARFAKVTECPQGHPYDEVNTNTYEGRRYCRKCQNSNKSRKKNQKGPTTSWESK